MHDPFRVQAASQDLVPSLILKTAELGAIAEKHRICCVVGQNDIKVLSYKVDGRVTAFGPEVVSAAGAVGQLVLVDDFENRPVPKG